MMSRKSKSAVPMVMALIFLLYGISFADTAEVLPKGVSTLSLNSKYFLPIDERYDDNGDNEDIDADFNANLNNSIFPALALVESGLGLPSGSASVGRSVVSFEYRFYIFEFSFQYGLTDRLTVGAMIPYWDVKNDVNARLDTTNATVGKTPIGVGWGAPISPLAGPFPDTVPLTTEDVQNLLGPGLDVDGDGNLDILGYGYEPVATWKENGFTDIEVGFRYQYQKTENWRLAFTSGVRLPTGEEDDPDNLVDYPLGSGTYTILFHSNNDYIGIENLVLNASFRYEWVLPHDEVLRVPSDVNIPITAVKEKVDRDIGDWMELEVSAQYQLTEEFSISALYQYGFAQKTEVSGSMPDSFYKPLEDETDQEEHIIMAGISYSTVSRYMKKEFPIPLTFSLTYRDRFDGKNNAFDSQYIGFNIQVYF